MPTEPLPTRLILGIFATATLLVVLLTRMLIKG